MCFFFCALKNVALWTLKYCFSFWSLMQSRSLKQKKNSSCIFNSINSIWEQVGQLKGELHSGEKTTRIIWSWKLSNWIIMKLIAYIPIVDFSFFLLGLPCGLNGNVRIDAPVVWFHCFWYCWCSGWKGKWRRDSPGGIWKPWGNMCYLLG